MKKSARLASALLALTATLAAADKASAQLRDYRYCEVLSVFLVEGALVADVWNTGGFSQCPQAEFAALDPAAIRQDLGALAVILNGPRYWTLDFIIGSPSSEVMTFGGLTMRLAATVELPMGAQPVPYSGVSVNRDTQFIFYAGSQVYELVDPMGRTYVMQSYSLQVDDTLTAEALPELGSRLQLPPGWTYRVRIVPNDFVVEDVAGVATVVQDELSNSYQFVPPCSPEEDQDGDGLCDGTDNCPLVANVSQLDTDGDGIGNACECGDFDLDGRVATVDARLVQRCAVGQIACAGLCDVTGDGLCSTVDARLIQRLAVQQLTKDDLSCAERP